MRHLISFPTIAVLSFGCAAKAPTAEVIEAPPAADGASEAESSEESADEAAEATTTPVSTKMTAEEIQWRTNPEAPDGPQMAMLRGNPAEGAFTFMAKFPAGYVSDVHSHSNDFAGVVVSGTLHHGRSADDFVSMTAGDTLAQPGSEVHYTACAEETECIIVGHMGGAMDTLPADAPAEGELSMVITAADQVEFTPLNPKAPEGPGMFVIHGDRSAGAFQALVKFPAGAASPDHNHTHTYSAAVLKGTVKHSEGNLSSGSAWSNVGGTNHVTACESADGDCIFFASMDGAFDMNLADAPPSSDAPPAEEAPAEEATE